MARKISAKERVSAVKDYVTSGESLRVVSARHGMSTETLRRFAGSKIKKRGRKTAKPVGTLSIPFEKVKSALENSNLRWKRSEDELLRDAVMGKFTVDEAVELLGRTRASVMCRKHHLIKNGFIDLTRFKVPTGPDRARHSKTEVAEVVHVATRIEPKKEAKEAKGDFNNLRELASIVRELGVNVTMVITEEGTEIKMSN